MKSYGELNKIFLMSYCASIRCCPVNQITLFISLSVTVQFIVPLGTRHLYVK